MKELQDFVNEVSVWALKTFPASSEKPLPKLYHLRKEVDEVIEALEATKDVSNFERAIRNSLVEREFADCLILLLQAVDRHGMSMDELLRVAKDKFKEAQTRKWGPPDEHGVIEHVRDAGIDPWKEGTTGPQEGATIGFPKGFEGPSTIKFIDHAGNEIVIPPGHSADVVVIAKIGEDKTTINGVDVGVGRDHTGYAVATVAKDGIIKITPCDPDFVEHSEWLKLSQPTFPEFPPSKPPAIQHEQTRTCASCGHTLSLDYFDKDESRCCLCDVPLL